MFRSLLPHLKNKYVIAIIAFLVWMLFFDRNNFINQVRLVNTLNDLNDQKEFFQREIRKDSAELHRLKTDTTSLEKFAREKYLMKKESEDLYVIVEE